MLGRQGQLLEKAALAYAQLTRSLRGAYAELTPILCSNPETKIASECLATNAVQHYGRQTVLLFSLASNRDEGQYGCFNRLVSLST